MKEMGFVIFMLLPDTTYLCILKLVHWTEKEQHEKQKKVWITAKLNELHSNGDISTFKL